MKKHLLLLLVLLLGSSTLPAQSKMDAAYQNAANKLDKIIAYGLKKYKKLPTKKIDDYAFARRVYLDAIGRIPTYNELAAFKKNFSRNKRNELIDKLIDSEGYVSHSYNYLADMLRVKNVPNFNANNYSEYIKESLRKNKPYDQFVRELVSSNGSGYKPGNGAAGYYLRDRGMLLDNLAMTMKVFLGTSMECAQCHDHPYDRWTQMDFYQLAAFTSGTKTVITSKKKDKVKGFSTTLKKDEYDTFRSLKSFYEMKYTNVNNTGTGIIRLPHDYDNDEGKPFQPVKAAVPFGPKILPEFVRGSENAMKSKSKKSIGPEINSRTALAKWITSRDNPMFTKALVNRLWVKIMGAPLISDPVDVPLKSRGANPYLTDELIKIMKAVNYDVRKFHKVILRTAAYQRQAIVHVDGEKYLSGAPVLQRLKAEQLWDSLLSLALEKPDISLIPAHVYGTHDLMYTKFKDMSNEEMLALARKNNGRKALRAYLNSELVKANASLIKDKQGPAEKKKGPSKADPQLIENLAKMKAQLARLIKKKKVALIDKVKKRIARIEKEIAEQRKPGGRKIGMSMMNMGGRNAGNSYSRASSIGHGIKDHFLTMFGQSSRAGIDGTSREASIPQAFNLLNGRVEDMFINNRKSFLIKLLDEKKDSKEKIKAAFLAILSREPKYSESTLFRGLFKHDAKSAEKDLIWVLINSSEFLFRK